MTAGLALLALAFGPAAAQADAGQSVTQPGSGAQTVSQPGQCIAAAGSGLVVTQGAQAQPPGAGAGACTAPGPPPVLVGAHRTHSKILRRGHRHPAGPGRSHRTR